MILDRFNKFFDLGDGYRRLGLCYKRGFLFHGEPGCGKTTLARMAAEIWVQRGGMVLLEGSQGELAEALEYVDVPIMVMIDDVDCWQEANLTHAMDGLSDSSNVVWVATTNFINKVSDRLKRPGRFDEVLEVKPPPPSDIIKWVRGLPIPKAQKDWVLSNSKDLTPSEVRELVIRCHLFEERIPIKTARTAK